MAMIEYLLIILFHFIMGTLMVKDVPRAVSCAEHINKGLDLTPEIQDTKNAAFNQNKSSLVVVENGIELYETLNEDHTINDQ
ncbi:hypothetical protein [Anaerocolumna jejuensis]|uniref:hypothetical protein n=1 Tax=Anaerocolumna jejuensis TaxID=259063 RepID=UPI003F7BBF57